MNQTQTAPMNATPQPVNADQQPPTARQLAQIAALCRLTDNTPGRRPRSYHAAQEDIDCLLAERRRPHDELASQDDRDVAALVAELD